MFALLANLLVLGSVGYLAWQGFQQGLCKSAIAAVQVLVAVVFAVLLVEPIGGLLAWLFQLLLGPVVSYEFPFQAWGLFLAFALLFGGLLGTTWWLMSSLIEDEELPVMPLADKLGGAFCGGLGGILLVGAVLVMWSMLPMFKGLKVPADRLFLDAGRMALWTGGRFGGDVHVEPSGTSRWLVLQGEPPSREGVKTSRLTSEPWHDLDDDGTCSEADFYCDVDGNASFTKDLYYNDLDGDGVRRIGLIEKYVAACWDSTLNSNERDRPKPKDEKPKDEKPVPAKPPTAADEKPPGEAKPVTPPKAVADEASSK